jgi:hypothetical protein
MRKQSNRSDDPADSFNRSWIAGREFFDKNERLLDYVPDPSDEPRKAHALFFAIQPASSERPHGMPAQFLQAVVIGLGRKVVEGVAEEVHIAQLEDRFGEDLADRHAKAGVIVGDAELDAVEPR